MRRTLTMLVAAATLTLAACGSDEGALDWPDTDDPSGARGAGLVWADAETGDIHLSGSTLAADRSISSFVIAGKGAYVVDKNDQALVEVTSDGARETGAYAEEEPIASPNGRYLAFIDPKAGPKYKGEVPQLVSVVVDLETGDEVFRSTRGMGDPDKDDLTALYGDAAYGVLAVTNKTAYILVPEGGVLAINLASSKVTKMPSDDLWGGDGPWMRPRRPADVQGKDWNPDRSWAIEEVRVRVPEVDKEKFQRRDVLVRADGTKVVPRPGTINWMFEHWIDKSTVVGYVDTYLVDPDPEFPDPDSTTTFRPSSLVTCTVPDGECTIVPDSDHAILPQPSLS
jgi:hypothetical protein